MIFNYLEKQDITLKVCSLGSKDSNNLKYYKNIILE